MIFVHSLIRQKALGALSTVLFISGAGATAYAAFPEQASLPWIWLNRFRMVFVWGNNCVWIKLPATAATTQHSSFPVMCHVSFRPQTQPQTGSFVVALVTALPAKTRHLTKVGICILLTCCLGFVSPVFMCLAVCFFFLYRRWFLGLTLAASCCC